MASAAAGKDVVDDTVSAENYGPAQILEAQAPLVVDPEPLEPSVLRQDEETLVPLLG